MLSVETKNKITLENYKDIIDDALYKDLLDISKRLEGIKICHVNATSYGGGVAEILQQEVPLARSLGIQVDWKVIKGSVEFFNFTKKIHNALQGNNGTMTENEWQIYEACNVDLAKQIDPENYDIIFVHDPQPAKIIACLEKGSAKWIWRCHLDTSAADKSTIDYFKKFLHLYDSFIFTMKEYVFEGLNKNVFIIPPAIDPLSDKNKFISKEELKKIISKFGVDPERPLITQVSRFDPWKDPRGVFDAYRMAKKKFGGLQLVYVGSMADDDPEAQEIFADLKKYAGNDTDVFLLSNLDGVGNIEINAFQTTSEIVLQKSIREGFGLTVAEALWKETPVIGGNVGGIPMQIIDGKCGYLVNSTEECAEKIIYLLENEEIAERMGKFGKEHIHKNFLLPKLLFDELTAIEELVATTKT